MNNTRLEQLIHQQLNSHSFSDYAPNGLQVEGRPEVKRVVTGVTACQALLDEAVKLQADAVIVHHGYFWKNESPLVKGMKRQRLRTLLLNDINLYGWHLPLDAHPELGNNAQLAKLLGIQAEGEIVPLVPYGSLSTPLSGEALKSLIQDKLGREPLHSGDNAPDIITRIAWCTGGDRALSMMRQILVLMPLLPVRSRRRLSMLPVSEASIFMRPVIMQPNAEAYVP